MKKLLLMFGIFVAMCSCTGSTTVSTVNNSDSIASDSVISDSIDSILVDTINID